MTPTEKYIAYDFAVMPDNRSVAMSNLLSSSSLFESGLVGFTIQLLKNSEGFKHLVIVCIETENASIEEFLDIYLVANAKVEKHYG